MSSQNQNARNMSARAPGSNGPAQLPSDPSGPQPGVAEVSVDPGSPDFSERYAEQQRTGSRSYSDIPHCDDCKPARPVVRHHDAKVSVGTGKLETETGAGLAGAADPDYAGG